MSVPLSLSFPQCEEDSSFSGGCPTEKQQNNLPLMTHSPTLRAPVHTTLSTATTAHLTTPRPGSKFSTACLTLCLPLYLPILLLFLYLPPLSGFLVKMSHCLPVHHPICRPASLPVCAVEIHTFWVYWGMPPLPVFFASIPAFLSLFFSLSLGTQLQSQNTEGHRPSTPLSAF